jgi:hypothetical protein
LFYLYYNNTAVPPASVPSAAVPLASVPSAAVPLASVPSAAVPLASVPSAVIERCICLKDPLGKCFYSKVGNGDKDMAMCGPPGLGGCKAPGCGIVRVLCKCAVDTYGKCVRADPRALCSMPNGICNNPACGTKEKVAALTACFDAERNVANAKQMYEKMIDRANSASARYQDALAKNDTNPLYQEQLNIHTANVKIYKEKYTAAQEAHKKAIDAYAALSSTFISTVTAFISAFGNISGFLNSR